MSEILRPFGNRQWTMVLLLLFSVCILLESNSVVALQSGPSNAVVSRSDITRTAGCSCLAPSIFGMNRKRRWLPAALASTIGLEDDSDFSRFRHEPQFRDAADTAEEHVRSAQEADQKRTFLGLPSLPVVGHGLVVPGMTGQHHDQVMGTASFQEMFGGHNHPSRSDRFETAMSAHTLTSSDAISEEVQAQPTTPDKQKKRRSNRVTDFLSGLVSNPRSNLISNSAEWRRLERHAKEIKEKTHLRELLQDHERCAAFSLAHDGVFFDFSRQRATEQTMQLLLDLADKQQLSDRIQQMVKGEKINFTEERAVLHTALRADRNAEPIMVDNGIDAIQEVHQVLDQIKYFTEGVRSGRILGKTGRRLRNIISVGIGGSYLGPEFLHEVLKTETEGINAALGYSLRFLSNVDPVDVERVCSDLDPEETLIVIVSKSFTTTETMLNARTMRQWMWDFMGTDPEVVRKHFVACASISSKEKVEEFGIDTENMFFKFWDWVGGRYSVCSAAGAIPISLLYGYDLFEKFLQGARSMDEHFMTTPLEKNIPVIMGLLGVWNMSFMGYNARTTLPYAEALLKLPAHIQQLDMESNGKYMTRHGIPIDYRVGEVDFGEPGTNGQHSFYQLLHMGQTVPCDFIGFCQSQHDLCLANEALSAHDELMANFFAQPDALANGKTESEVRAEGVPEHLIPHKVFPGNRPSTSILLPKATAYVTGQLLALYEHRTAVQGFIWDINSFDQWGVELGKKLAIEVKDHLRAARNKQGQQEEIEADNPATSRLLNYYIRQSTCVGDECEVLDPSSSTITTVTRKTHKEHYSPETSLHNIVTVNGELNHHHHVEGAAHLVHQDELTPDAVAVFASAEKASLENNDHPDKNNISDDNNNDNQGRGNGKGRKKFFKRRTGRNKRRQKETEL